LWSCKCRCGDYEIRTAKAFKNHIKFKENFDLDTCQRCSKLKKIKNMASAKAMGYEYKEYMEKFYRNSSFDRNK
jgi:hypothetical protein